MIATLLQGQGKDARLEKGAAPPAKAPPWRHPRGYMRTRPSRGFYNLVRPASPRAQTHARRRYYWLFTCVAQRRARLHSHIWALAASRHVLHSANMHIWDESSPPRVQSAKDINGEEVSFERYAGKVVLVVNVASACGFTHANYVGLQALYDKYRDYGLEILAFPSNQFGGQEPGTEAEIKEFARSKYSVTFPMFSKVDVNGPDTHPVYQCALAAAPGARVRNPAWKRSRSCCTLGSAAQREHAIPMRVRSRPRVVICAVPTHRCARRFLKRELPEELGGGSGKEVGKDLVWNFNKFLVDRHGRPTAFYYSSYDAAKLEPDVYRLLQQT